MTFPVVPLRWVKCSRKVQREYARTKEGLRAYVDHVELLMGPFNHPEHWCHYSDGMIYDFSGPAGQLKAFTVPR